MKLRNFVMFGSMAAVCAAFTSCSKGEDLFDSGAYVAKQKSEYATNFEKKYGPIDPNQNWDLATMGHFYTLPSTGSAARTRSTAVSVNIEEENDQLNFGQDVIEWMHTNMKAGKNNTAMGSPFYMVTQDGDFTIVPFYQGVASYFWELWVNIGGVERKLWSKYDKLQYKTPSGEWKTPTAKEGVPANAVAINAPQIKVDATKDLQMFFYLKIWHKEETHTTKAADAILSSLDQKMLALQGVNKPSCITGDYDVTIIGCEDGTDSDYEDLVFLMYGTVPPLYHVDVVEDRVTKRYMMEDLGTTDDFDFNDVVVDVSDVHQKKIKYEYDSNHRLVFKNEEETLHYQDAVVRAAGGTINFSIQIGKNTTWSKSDALAVKDMKNTGWGGSHIYYDGEDSELAKFIIKNNEWKPAENNIQVTVEDKGATDGVKVIKFPKLGEAPMIIAVNKTQNWMSERSSVPSDWWY